MSLASLIILLATPLFFILIAIELIFDHKRKTHYYRFNDAIASLSLGIVSRTHRLITLSLAAFVYDYLQNALDLYQLDSNNPLIWIFGFIFYDFLYYWAHRMSHSINFLWAGHVVHHQSEDFNLTTALRQSSSSAFKWIFYIPSFLIGIPAEVFFVSGALNLIYQFWVHTQHIKTLGWFEKVFVTPSHHRVHHGQNALYIDKNHGGVFILWDKWFGTFEPESPAVPVIYGVRKPLASLNPIWANFQHWWQLLIDAFRTRSIKNKFLIWFKPTGWRPEDVIEKYPLQKSDLNHFVKYNPECSQWTKIYILVQFILFLFLSTWFLISMQNSDFTTKMIFWVLITFPLWNLAILQQQFHRGFFLELIRIAGSVLVLIYYHQTISNQYSIASGLIAGYLMMSLIGLLLIFWHHRTHQNQLFTATDSTDLAS